MNDHFLKAWAEQKLDSWAAEAEQDRQARLATKQGAPGSRLRLLFDHLFHALRVRHHQARSDEVLGVPRVGDLDEGPAAAFKRTSARVD